MNSCPESELLEQYINRRLTAAQNCEIITHVAKCEDCRREIAFLLKLKSQLQTEAPPHITAAAFAKLPQRKVYTYADAIDALRNATDIMRQTLYLANILRRI